LGNVFQQNQNIQGELTDVGAGTIEIVDSKGKLTVILWDYIAAIREI